jgi:hypothetical protein
MITRNLPGGKGRPIRKADNLTAIYEPLSRKCGSLDVSQTYGPPRPVTAFVYGVKRGILLRKKNIKKCKKRGQDVKG